MTPVLSKETTTLTNIGSVNCQVLQEILNQILFLSFFQNLTKTLQAAERGKIPTTEISSRHTQKSCSSFLWGYFFFVFLKAWFGAVCFFFLIRFVEFHSVKKKSRRSVVDSWYVPEDNSALMENFYGEKKLLMRHDRDVLLFHLTCIIFGLILKELTKI